MNTATKAEIEDLHYRKQIAEDRDRALLTPLRFFWNGIKASDGKLQRCDFFYGGELLNCPTGTITIYAERRFSAEIAQFFTVENGSDMMTDYFENDRIRVIPDHPLYPQVAEALAKRKAHYDKRFAGVVA